MAYVHVATGKEFTGRVPRVVTAHVGVQQGDVVVIQRVEARLGEANYSKVLEQWLFERGYIRTR